MLPDRVSNPGPLTYESGALPIALRGRPFDGRVITKGHVPWSSIFLTYETAFVLFLAMLENSVLPMGCDSSHETLKVTSVVYKRRALL